MSRFNHLTELLQLRSQWIKRIRDFFHERDFIEVQTPVLSRDTVVDRYIEPIPVYVERQGREKATYWLQTSPEFCLKRMLAAGAQAIFEITPAFRAGENGAQHNIEFTMLEWYRVGDDYRAGMDLLDDFVCQVLQMGPTVRLTYQEAFQEFAHIDPFGNSAHDLNQLLVDQVEPGLKELGSVIIFDWPADQCALAKIRPTPFPVAERFELYVNGVELANGYHELCDADELLQRNLEVNQLREADGKQALPVDSRLLEAMRGGLPPSCGVALGFDRMLMVATGCDSIEQIIPFIE